MVTRVWARFETGDDGGEAYAAFQEWLHLPPDTRPDVETFARYGDERTTRSSGKYAQIRAWATAWLWEDRAAEYDQWSSQAPARRLYPICHPVMLTLARMVLAELKKFEAAQSKAGEVPGYLTFDQCVRVFRAIASAEKEVGRLKASKEEALARGDQILDISKLTLEEQRTLESIWAKATSETG